MEQDTQVVPFLRVPPKREEIKYKNRQIIVTFNPDTGKFHWSFHEIVDFDLAGSKDTFLEAVRDAKRHIDEITND